MQPVYFDIFFVVSYVATMWTFNFSSHGGPAWLWNAGSRPFSPTT
jgi:hypothetical protein